MLSIFGGKLQPLLLFQISRIGFPTGLPHCEGWAITVTALRLLNISNFQITFGIHEDYILFLLCFQDIIALSIWPQFVS